MPRSGGLGGLFPITLRKRPVGVAYGVWVGIGASATALLAVPLFGETVSVLKILSLLTVVAGVVGLTLASSGSHG